MTSTGSVELELGQIGDQRSVAAVAEPLARLLDHRLGAVDGDHAARRAGARSARGDPAASRSRRRGRASSPRSSSRSSTAIAPVLEWGSETRVVGLGVPVAGPVFIGRSRSVRARSSPGRGRPRPAASKLVDRAGVLERDADVVEAVQQPVLDVGLDLELEDAGGAGDGLVVDVDPRLARLGDGAAVLLVEDRRQQPDLGAVDVEDVGEGRRDDRLEAEVLERPGGVLARGAAAEVGAR